MFSFHIKNSLSIIPTFLTNTRKMLEHIIVYCFVKTCRIAAKFAYVPKVGNITLYVKNNQYMYRFYNDTSKV